MSEQFHGAPTAAEWAICRGREMRIQNFNMQPVFNVQSFATGKWRFAPEVPRFHLFILPPRIWTYEAQGMKPNTHSYD